MLNSNNLKRQLRKINKTKLFEDCTRTFGTFIRMARLDHHMTLAEVSGDRMSVSQNCKIEYNEVVPDKDTQRYLLEKTKFSKEGIELIENSEEIMFKAFMAYKDSDYDSLKDLYLKFGRIRGNQFSMCIDLGYYCLNDLLKEAKNLIDSYKKIADSFCPSVLILYSLYVCTYYYKIHNYKEALDILPDLLNRVDSKELNILIKDLYYLIAVEINKPGIAFKLKKELIEEYTNRLDFKNVTKIYEKYLVLLFNEKEYDLLIEDGKNLTILESDKFFEEYNYLMGVSYLKIGYKDEARLHLSKLNSTSKFYLKSVNERFELSLIDDDLFIENTIEENKNTPSFYLEYFINKKRGESIDNLFLSTLFLNEYINSNLFDKINLLLLKADYDSSKRKYKIVFEDYLRIEELRTNYK